MKATIIGVPMDLGQNRRGVDMGPSAIRYANLNKKLEEIGVESEDKGNIPVSIPERNDMTGKTIKYPEQIYEACTLLAEQVADQAQEGSIPIVLGGDHSIAMGSIAGMKKAKGEMGVIWIDAHSDLNTFETSPSGNIHGMPLAFSMGCGESNLKDCLEKGQKVKPENTVLIGTREIDPGERELIENTGVKVFTMYDLDKLGMNRVMEEALAIVTSGTDGVHVSLDMDSLDPMEAPGVGTPVKGGINYREAHLAMELLAEKKCLSSIEVVEVNPILDHRNSTANLAVELIASAFGDRVL
ncbi:arginase [Natranaerobius trueperi]|uniref:Arginase n=1 Tax=Natranaerobius trueperi TaxID=759412 RepID=A0A226C080_9FIRM|nr:arginase [Natranaerobius trueperi]OWZ84452.1 arginase [Natranaerobius trueperi]